MAESVDPVLVREHQQSWHSFTKFVMRGTVIVCAILLFLYFFVA
jgi:hypothetical protein